MHKSLRFVVFTTADYVTAMQYVSYSLAFLSFWLAKNAKSMHARRIEMKSNQLGFHKYHCVYLMQLIEVNQFMVILTRDNNIKAAL